MRTQNSVRFVSVKLHQNQFSYSRYVYIETKRQIFASFSCARASDTANRFQLLTLTGRAIQMYQNTKDCVVNNPFGQDILYADQNA